ncbi:adaptor protein MecA [Brevibacillus sp. NPDC003359]|uniref:adaptor protein MecA n=1 Tax=unclassified Brevibacillus TaxID=2684853 RepID=UPI0036A9145D
MKIKLLAANQFQVVSSMSNLIDIGIIPQISYTKIGFQEFDNITDYLVDEAKQILGIERYDLVGISCDGPESLVVTVTLDIRKKISSEVKISDIGRTILQYSFAQNEDLFTVGKELFSTLSLSGGSVYHYQGRYILILDVNLPERDLLKIEGLIGEYSEPSSYRMDSLINDGKVIFAEEAFQAIDRYFGMRSGAHV